jgi:hypothetical protein
MSLVARSDRQIPYSKVEAGDHMVQLDVGVRARTSGSRLAIAPVRISG